MMNIGRLCMKITGRDAGKKAVIIAVLNKSQVLIDGETRRRKCSTSHLEPLNQTLSISENASHEDVKQAFKQLGIELKEKRKVKPAQPAQQTAAKKEILKKR